MDETASLTFALRPSRAAARPAIGEENNTPPASKMTPRMGARGLWAGVAALEKLLRPRRRNRNNMGIGNTGRGMFQKVGAGVGGIREGIVVGCWTSHEPDTRGMIDRFIENITGYIRARALK